MKRSRLPRYTRLARTGKLKPKKRKASEFNRIYGSRARVAWVRSLPCVVPTCMLWTWGGCENAHTETGGTGRKADAETIAPICPRHHRLLHEQGAQWFQSNYGVDLKACAEATEAAWRLRCAA